VAAELVLNGGSGKRRGRELASSLFDDARRSVEAKNKRSPDFWTLIAEPELRLYEALVRGTIVKQAPAIVRAFRDVHRRSQGAAQWASVADTLRFVLDPYLEHATQKTGAAAQRVLAEIMNLAKSETTDAGGR
jgi:hypothetical protein